MKQSPKQPAPKRRAQLIKAAEKVFGRKGYAGATTEEIARAAGLTKGALYFHFENKEDIFFAVVREVNNRFKKLVLEYLDCEPDPDVLIEKAVCSVFSMIRQHRYFSIDFWQRAHKIARIKNYLAEEHRELRDRLVRYLRTHGNLSRRDGESFFDLLHAVFNGIMIGQILSPGKYDLDRLIPQVIEMSKLYLRKDKLKLD